MNVVGDIFKVLVSKYYIYFLFLIIWDIKKWMQFIHAYLNILDVELESTKISGETD